MEIARFPSPIFLDVRDRSHVGEARRNAIAYAESCGFGETKSAVAGLIVTELTNNLVLHAIDGHVTVQCLAADCGDSIEILSIDRGPGMKDVGKCLQDGFTTGGTAGNGLGAVRRLADQFDIYSVPAQGTAIVARVFRDGRSLPVKQDNVMWSVYFRPVSGETVSGDSWRVDCAAERLRFMVCDGLGHGPIAAKAAEAVTDTFENEPSFTPVQFLDAAHRKAIGTRGAAVAIALAEMSSRRIQYAGVGNISGFLVEGETSKGLFSQNGTIGVVTRKPQAFEYMWPVNGILVMHSDGLRSRWSLAGYPGLQMRHPAIIAGILARDFSRGHDDLTVLVARIGGKGSD